MVRTGCAWRYLPVDFPPWQTVYGHFKQFNERGTTERILDELREQVRTPEGRDPPAERGDHRRAVGEKGRHRRRRDPRVRRG
ncbi:transposase [Actinoplanes sp. CA-030573]|uniref:transposase n=1 Tax=Actinoplanes sp. CA-030573 TaxID=3239898 RepID=UPI003D8A9E22